MPEEIFSNAKVQIIEDEGLGGLVVFRIKKRKTDIGITVLVGNDDIRILGSRDEKMELVVHNGSPAVSVKK